MKDEFELRAPFYVTFNRSQRVHNRWRLLIALASLNDETCMFTRPSSSTLHVQLLLLIGMIVLQSDSNMIRHVMRYITNEDCSDERNCRESDRDIVDTSASGKQGDEIG